MIYKLRVTSNALNDLDKFKKSGDQKILQKIETLFEELRSHPRTGTGHPELLKNEASNLYSRRINKKHRLVYRVEDEM
jgi:toxin YoeB